MTDFTSSLYLGLRHASASLPPWARLTTGVPAALRTPRLSRTIGGRLAELTGTERVTLCRSTLHAFWDLFLILRNRDTTIYLDASAYPIARWGVERAACHGTPVRIFKHHDVADLWRQVTRDARRGQRPIVVTDGFCTGCGSFAPLRYYLAQALRFGGMVVVDDTQALAIFGHSSSAAMPYGFGGGGSLSTFGISDPRVMLVSSMAKGFGVPMAMVAGSAGLIAAFEQRSTTRVHSSPPSFADLHATRSALDLNRSMGDAVRARLTMLVRRFRRGLHDAGIQLVNSPFPVQSPRLRGDVNPMMLYRRLQRMGIGAVLHRPACRPGATVSFIITARHTPADIDRAVRAVAHAIHSDVPRTALRRACG